MDKTELLKTMLSIVEQIETKEKDLLVFSLEKQEYINKIVLIKTNIELDVYTNKMYKNDTTREAKALLLTRNNDEYKEASRRANDLDRDIKTREIELETLKNKFECYKVISGGII